MLAAERGQFRQHLGGPAEPERGGEPVPAGVEPAGRPAGGGGVPVGEVGEGGAPPEGECVVQEVHGAGRVAVREGPRAFAGEPLEAEEVDGLRFGGQPVAALRRGDGLVPDGPPQPSDQRLERAGRVGGRFAVPHLVDEHADRDRPAGPQREHGEQRAQPRPADGVGRAVVAECLGGAEDAVAHAPILRDPRRRPHSRPAPARHGPTLSGAGAGSEPFPPCRRQSPGAAGSAASTAYPGTDGQRTVSTTDSSSATQE